MLTVHHLTKYFNIQPILNDVSFTINPGDRVGLIGPNGAGKTTLLRLLTGQEQPDKGQVVLTPANLRVGYLAQGFEPEPTLTVAGAIGAVAGDEEALVAEVGHLATALAADPLRPELQAAYDTALEQLSRIDNGRSATTLTALGLDSLPPDQPVHSLSGGQKTRLALALTLLNEPQLLLLDEPTNHLDIGMLEWLEEWLAGFPGAALIVSHDRTFLDRTATRILDLDPEKQTIRDYVGNYTDYLEQYLDERERQWSAYRDQVAEVRRMRQDIARTREQALSVERSTTPRQPTIRRYAKKVAKKAASREKKLDRYLAGEERVEKPGASWQMKMALNDAPHLGQDVLTLADLAVGYPGYKPLLQGINQQAQAGQRIVLTGPNGAGKTTLLRTIAGRLAPVHGRVRLGASVRLGYMAQEQELLDPARSPLELIQQAAPLNQTEARSFLHFFLFSGDDPLRPSAQLSYGERARLSLAILVAQGCNFLLLDEPINHLDIPSRSRFEEALRQFEGTVLAVVHDRYFIERFASQIWLVDGGTMHSSF
jgi:ATP-binding cassette, subfamily F, member 3